MSRKLLGGSQGEEDQPSSFGNGFFHEGVKWYQTTGKTAARIRLLPAFDMSYSPNDDAFATSYVPYRIKGAGEDEQTKTPAFSPWYFSVMGYAFWGKENRRFLSPLTLEGFPYKSGIDPAYDVYRYIKKLDDKVSANKELQEKYLKSGLQDERPCYFPSTSILANALVENDETKEWENKIVIFSNSALKDMKDALAREPGRSDPEISKDWPEYKLGDITAPETGAIATIRQRQVAQSGPMSACLFFTHNPNKLDGYEPFTFDPASAEGQAYLSGRYDISDCDNVLHFHDYDEILEWMA
jgi:hypothetical protein